MRYFFQIQAIGLILAGIGGRCATELQTSSSAVEQEVHRLAHDPNKVMVPSAPPLIFFNRHDTLGFSHVYDNRTHMWLRIQGTNTLIGPEHGRRYRDAWSEVANGSYSIKGLNRFREKMIFHAGRWRRKADLREERAWRNARRRW
ncbi:hypothetical protein CBOM_00711 [Ceraceosorus bombacis]|uniref:Uncharacterized protein n=1 Tax=Ceraceosorus bombacis TaxID=401625 RepID=A0A0P1B9T9_9BASI|nr:hypothetical protein CBOM_00711 [Ceraceosorus bombacis]